MSNPASLGFAAGRRLPAAQPPPFRRLSAAQAPAACLPQVVFPFGGQECVLDSLHTPEEAHIALLCLLNQGECGVQCTVSNMRTHPLLLPEAS